MNRPKIVLLLFALCLLAQHGVEASGSSLAAGGGNDTEAKLAKLVKIFSKPGAFSQVRF